jgi:hypothetical protein
MDRLSLPAPIEVNLERPLANGIVVSEPSTLGEVEALVQRMTDALREADSTTLATLRMGIRADIVAAGGRTSFAVFPFTDDGQSPALLEAMGAGCIPISYRPPARSSRGSHVSPRSVDPESFANTFRRNVGVIRHRKNGFLVENDSLPSLVATIVFLQNMTPEQVLSLRRRAITTAQKIVRRHTRTV